MRRPVRLAFVAFWLVTLLPLAVRAQPSPGADVSAAYTVYAAGLATAHVGAELTFGESSYQLRLHYRTAGLFGTFVHVESNTLAQGVWQGDDPVPFHFAGSGRVQGETRQTVIDFQKGEPLVRTLVPPNEAERDPVPPALERNTIDTLSAMALLIRRVAETGRCEAHAATFDGRRLIDVSAHTVGTEALPHSDRSPFSGPTLHCDFEGQQLAGFRHGENPAELRRPKRGSAWFARVVPGAPPIPIRLSFETRWFGVATLYLTRAEARPPAPAATLADTAHRGSP